MLHSNQEGSADLPLDVILLIAEFLDTVDLKQCIFVSTVWNATFRSILYRTAKLQRYDRFCTFYRTIEQSARKTKRNGKSGIPLMQDLGHCVRTLHLRDGFLTITRMQQLGDLCPNVDSVQFDWEVKYRIVKTSSSARLFQSPLPFFQHFHAPNLCSLTLRRWEMPSRRRRMPDNFAFDTLIPVLFRLPQLESLTVHHTRFLTYACMECIHIACPRLKQLSMADESINGMLDHTLPLSVIENVNPARTMESLSIAGCPVWTNPDVLDGPWFAYITHKYPALKHLNIAWRASRFNPVVTAPPSSQASLTIAFRDYFPRLEELVIGMFAGHRTTVWPRLVQGIQRVTLHDDSIPSFSDWVSSEATANIIQLSLCRFPESFHGLRHCSQLQELTLSSGTDQGLQGVNREKGHDIDLDIILSCCPALKKLKIWRGNMRCASNTSAEGAKSHLRTLILHWSVLTSNTVLENVGQWCPELIHLELSYCMWIISDGDPIIRINLPHHWLSSFCMADARVYRPEPLRPRGEPLARNRYLMVKASGWDEDRSPLFYTICDAACSKGTPLRRIENPAIVRWLNFDTDNSSHDSDYKNVIRNEAIEAIESIRGHEVRDAKDNIGHPYREYAAEYNHASCAVLRCCKVDRLYYGRDLCRYFRAHLDSHTP